ncbi:MAG: ParB/RepB/Spo0J family partition protein [Myxococcota bacterium]|jgi:ParB family chromosome partitioning protein|nr:ParB/RepB/Spo0J family partition protein [Myxococcota bacterium]MEC9388845.1 ParB/RepB/Spo0J family partition protein [Myxococcota bacterium]
MTQSRLGRGLAALIPSDILESPGRPAKLAATGERGALRMVPLDQVRPNPEQPRMRFNANELESLASSISEHGVITPLLVRADEERGGYILIAGERRLRASGLAGLDEVPVWVHDSVSSSAQLLLALVENIQREDLDALETALAYQRLIEDFNLTQGDVARRVGKDRTTVANAIRLLRLPEFALAELRAGTISAGHAKALLSLSDDSLMRKALTDIVKNGLSVRGAERLVQRMMSDRRPSTPKPAAHRHAAALLTSTLGTKVRIQTKARGDRGQITIDFHSKEDLTRLVDWLARTDSPMG